jgi:hypothetical protein
MLSLMLMLFVRRKSIEHQKHANSLLHVLQLKYIQFIQHTLLHISHV